MSQTAKQSSSVLIKQSVFESILGCDSVSACTLENLCNMNVLISLCDPKQTDPCYDVMVFESHKVVLMQIQNKPNEI